MNEKTNMPADSFVLGAPAPTTPYVPNALPAPSYGPKTSTKNVRLVAGIAAFMVGAVGGFLGWRMLFGGYGFPDQVAGVSRIESDAVDAGVDYAQGLVASTGIDVEIDYAFYGSSIIQPQYMMFAASIDEETLEMMLATSPQGSPTEFVQCQPDRDGTACMWLEGHTVVGVYGWGASPESLNPQAQLIQGG